MVLVPSTCWSVCVMTVPQCLRFSSRSAGVMDSKQGDRVTPFINASCDLFFLVSPSFGCRERNLRGHVEEKGDSLPQYCPSPKGDLISLPVLLYFCRGMCRRDQSPCVEAVLLTYSTLKPAHLSLGAPVSMPSKLCVREGTLVSRASTLVEIFTLRKLVSSDHLHPDPRASC